jgi:hypothetical protein
MANQLSNKKGQILTELGEETEQAELVQTMEHLDHFTVDAPSAESVEALIAFLKPILQEELFMTQEDDRVILTSEEPSVSIKVGVSGRCRMPGVLQLVQPQAMLLSRWFVLASVLILIVGLWITKAVNGNMLHFLANASPFLGIFTVFYEFRAKLSGTLELEIACPYSPAQLAAARLLVVLSYDILLCLVATPFVSYCQGQMLWQVIVSWFAPLLLVLGIALAVALRFGIVGGCLVAATIWMVQLAASARGPMAVLLLPKKVAIFADFISMGVGALLLLYAYLHWKSNSTLPGDTQDD